MLNNYVKFLMQIYISFYSLKTFKGKLYNPTFFCISLVFQSTKTLFISILIIYDSTSNLLYFSFSFNSFEKIPQLRQYKLFSLNY